MNYYFPFNSIPYETQSTGLLSRIFKNGINWSSILTNTQKTLNIINQAIPVIKQAKPVINNAKTMFKVMNEFKKIDVPKKSKVSSNEKEIVTEDVKKDETGNINSPTFFL